MTCCRFTIILPPKSRERDSTLSFSFLAEPESLDTVNFGLCSLSLNPNSSHQRCLSSLSIQKLNLQRLVTPKKPSLSIRTRSPKIKLSKRSKHSQRTMGNTERKRKVDS